ncbi:class I SAM-dependent methyltransferase [Shewanella amazonensis]|uniref:Ribosomal RNA small subunit methyltransferase C n=1 Tax=Shewanella amazonensis (strain ATCC BAA-1098 / SB2B) TaxID=326297 RepID=RSMC_SHEAM|nr:class I SAM-dependent methyltransferase [Shewanella amazonensis]A1S321.2 RecName: Full=Ribosomal RNA small subunit methyltransferase C; AltName: Full=16S rRNA m2G1207 methyltransferase; AltName: Full=rRNA (guanine-N(2)-)-methyltransferase RsmC [Shewanella amazonensis SB2B]
MLSNPSELVTRNIEQLENQRVMLINIEADELGHHLTRHCSEVAALALDFNHFQAQPSGKSGFRCEFGHQWSRDEKFDVVVVYFPKAKALAPYLFALAAWHLRPDGTLLITGENKGGIRSVDKLLGNAFSPACKIDNARHCLLYSATLVAEATKPNAEDWVSRYRLSLPSGDIQICNMVGVFSDKQLDQGTALLLDNLPKLEGRVLDFGCGAGVIAIALMQQNPGLQLECVDINAMALLSCELSLKANGMEAKVYASDGLAQTDGLFNAIVSNPPFHDGLSSTTDIATRFVADSYKQLHKGGNWQIVANRHLPYSDTIAKVFGEVNTVAENNKYKVYANKKR